MRTSASIGFAASVCFLLLLTPPPAVAGPYADSAHGNSGYGVLRTDLTGIYARGNCAHCHLQHASMEGTQATPNSFALFAPTDTSVTSAQSINVCFECHQTTTVTNNNYAANFGGDPSPDFTNIRDAFALSVETSGGSLHNLDVIYTLTQSNFSDTFGGTVPDGANPCSGCHNAHLAQRIYNPVMQTYDPAQSPLSPPNAHNTLWGSDVTERMDTYLSIGITEYRAPFYYGADPSSQTTLREPDGASRFFTSPEARGSSTPDYNTFCISCHQNAIGSVEAINFSATGDKHGLRPNTLGGNQGNRIAPYTTDGTINSSYAESINFVLSCLDCHEPHGSNNIALLRSTVNGKTGIVVTTGNEAVNFCTACHQQGHQAGNDCLGCHNHNQIQGGNKYTF